MDDLFYLDECSECLRFCLWKMGHRPPPLPQLHHLLSTNTNKHSLPGPIQQNTGVLWFLASLVPCLPRLLPFLPPNSSWADLREEWAATLNLLEYNVPDGESAQFCSELNQSSLFPARAGDNQHRRRPPVHRKMPTATPVTMKQPTRTPRTSEV